MSPLDRILSYLFGCSEHAYVAQPGRAYQRMERCRLRARHDGSHYFGPGVERTV